MTSEMLLALFCIGATLLFLGIRRALILRADRQIRRCGATLTAERDSLEGQANELEAMQAEIGEMKAKLVELSTEKLILNRRGGKRAATTRRSRSASFMPAWGTHKPPSTMSDTAMRGPRSEPPMPTLIRCRMRLPVAPTHAPLRTLSLNARIRDSVSLTP